MTYIPCPDLWFSLPLKHWILVQLKLKWHVFGGYSKEVGGFKTQLDCGTKNLVVKTYSPKSEMLCLEGCNG